MACLSRLASSPRGAKEDPEWPSFHWRCFVLKFWVVSGRLRQECLFAQRLGGARADRAAWHGSVPTLGKTADAAQNEADETVIEPRDQKRLARVRGEDPDE